MQRRISLVLGPALAITLGTAIPARANAPAPPVYEVHVDENTVHVCTTYGDCPSQGPLLREDEDGDVVSLSSCASYESRQCYVDECVAPGTYRYGLEAPYECSRYYDPPYYELAVVTDALESCERSLESEAPEDYDAPVPWLGQEQWQDCDVPPDCSIGGASDPVFVLQLLAFTAGVLLVLRRRRRPQ